jgi:hypothetical protein
VRTRHPGWCSRTAPSYFCLHPYKKSPTVELIDTRQPGFLLKLAHAGANAHDPGH